MKQPANSRPCSGSLARCWRSSLTRLGYALCAILGLLLLPIAAPAEPLTLALKQVDIRDVMVMLSKQQRLNIFLDEGVDGEVTVNLYDMEPLDAITAIAESVGFAVEQRRGSIYIIDRDDAGKYHTGNLTDVRTFKLQYITPGDAESVIKEHLSELGSIKTISANKLLIVEDSAPFLQKIERLLDEIDRQPRQILIEAKILEVTLTDNQSFGLDWSRLYTTDTTGGSIGVQGLASTTTPGLFAQYSNENVTAVLNALKERGRLSTLATPRLLAMEDRQAETVVGTQIGFKVTTTVNQVTSESIEFLETGIILKVTPSVDRAGRILLDIEPEVSTGAVSSEGIPSKTTTQVSSRMLVPDGKTVFMGGLIRRSSSNNRQGVPGLGDIPVLGYVFSNSSENYTTTEIIILLTPRIVDLDQDAQASEAVLKVEMLDKLLGEKQTQTEVRPDIRFPYDPDDAQ
jgi:type II secretory pathway component GspD/PulD (secretin)